MGNCPACFNGDEGEAVESVKEVMETSTNGQPFGYPLPHGHKACVKTVIKKVRFADEVELISSSEKEQPITSNNMSEELHMKEGSELSGIVKVRVVITKKQYTELMSPTSTAHQKQQNDALIESMLAPLLSLKPHHSDHTCRDQNPNLAQRRTLPVQPLIF